MKRSAKITTAAVAAVVVAGVVALAAPAMIDALPRVSAPTEQATPPAAGHDDAAERTIVPASGPGDCTSSARIEIGSDDGSVMHAALRGDLVEMGASALANGVVTRDAEGEIFSYEVAPGDSLIAIGERFCVDYVTVGSFNHVRGAETISPGDILYLRPDPTIPFVDPYSPYNAEPGSSTIPYYDGVAAFSTAVTTADLGAARWLWQRLEKDMPPETAAVITQALSNEDLSLLRRMFP
ncbi:LysM domain-containing protein [Microbacterium sp. MYb62]|uniref:LysM peptidoglycan-binding domain-containing protein n=1 Tax=Microbacterium sp. MYb62 TaxID=1848690 RepID=UPI000CFBC103|nr:LysM domain-containing protein [Microbacterium sp. MYb62]PRB13244.1 hypothetical protein CQ042_13745 [Microbacterium sp. MYb62]